jgi:NADH:ubiquinone oxidoreductase subunit F (NADH-binding)
VVNNVESVASVPAIINNGVAWFNAMGTEKSKGLPSTHSLAMLIILVNLKHRLELHYVSF